MKSTSGEHYVALDHVRAMAALLVFVWHSMHGLHGAPVPFAGAVCVKQPDANVIVPTHKSAVCSVTGGTRRDRHIRDIAEHGRIGWQKENGYGLRAYIELAIQRYKRIFGRSMKARALPQPKTESWFGASALNMMTYLGTPIPVQI